MAGINALGDDYHDHGFLYLSPEPKASYESELTRYVLVRFIKVDPTSVTNLPSFITVTGEYSGIHTGQTHIASDHRTVIFEMSKDFESNELVTVTLNPRTEGPADIAPDPYEYQFMIAGPFPGSLPLSPAKITAYKDAFPEQTTASGESGPAPLSFATPGQAGIMPNGVSVPSDFPHVNITVNSNPDPDYIFINNIGGRNYNIIFDNTGSPVWYQKTSEDRRDMKVQPNGVLTMMARNSGNRFIGLNTNYEQIAAYVGVNGYTADEHELIVQRDGTYFMVVIAPCIVDMSRYVIGGKTNALVYESAVQEFTAEGELIFQWRSWDHYDIRDVRLDNIKDSLFHFCHMNAVDIDTDGNMLVSCRHLSEVTKVDLDSGEVIWRLGGMHGDFTFVNDLLNGFENQHTIRTVGTNDYILFDNGDLHVPRVSRAVEYELNLNERTATMVWQYPPTPTTSLYSLYMGNVQRLGNGNTLINWAVPGLPKLTEVRPDGTKAFELNWVAGGYQTYRTWRCPWNGMALKPNLIIESYTDHLLLLFNKFGDTNVAYYRIYGGTAENPTNLIAASSTTLAELQDLENDRRYFFRVTAVSQDGTESDFSDEASVDVNILKPGDNIIKNGDFSSGSSSWYFAVAGQGSGTWTFADEQLFVSIGNPGTRLADVLVGQAGLRLIQGRTYHLEFDAWSVQPRAIQAELSDPSHINAIYATFDAALTPVPKHFTYTFSMSAVTDLRAQLAFLVGASSSGVYLDNVSMYFFSQGDANQDGCIGFDDLRIWSEDWLLQGNGLFMDLDGSGRVDFGDFRSLGEDWSGGNCP